MCRPPGLMSLPYIHKSLRKSNRNKNNNRKRERYTQSPNYNVASYTVTNIYRTLENDVSPPLFRDCHQAPPRGRLVRDPCANPPVRTPARADPVTSILYVGIASDVLWDWIFILVSLVPKSGMFPCDVWHQRPGPHSHIHYIVPGPSSF